MKKQQKQLIILLAVLVVLTAGFFALKYYNKVQSEKAEEPTGDVVFDIEESDIVKVTYDYSGETNSFERVDDTWYYVDDHSLDINQYSINNMTSKWAGLRAEQTIENVTDMSQYGLDADARTVCFETAGESYIFLIGDSNAVTDVYYVCKMNDTTVYAVSSSMIAVFNNTLDDVVKESVSDGDAAEEVDSVSDGDATEE